MSSIGNAFGNNDFTIEFYINPVLDANRYVLSSGYFIANQWYIALVSTGSLQFWLFDYNSTGVPFLITPANTLTANTSYHVALVRKGATYIFFINGINTVQYISPVPYNIGNNTSIISIGYLAPSGFSYFNGKIDELRITNGIARYTTNFTVSIPTTGYPSIGAPFNVNLLSQAQSLTTETAISASSAAVSTSNLVIDPYYNKVTTLLHFNDGTFADNSVFNNQPANTLTTYSTAQTTIIGTLPIGSSYFNGSSQIIYPYINGVFATYSFTNGNGIGATGPTSVIYSGYSVVLSGGIQYWTVPATRNYTFVIAGAGNINTNSLNSVTTGYGVMMIASYSLIAGSIIAILVGQQGINYNGGSGGAGGTFICSVTSVGALSSATKLFIAGGAGGIGYESNAYANTNVNGTFSNIGQNGTGGNAAAGGAGPNGGSINSQSNYKFADAGAGFSGNSAWGGVGCSQSFTNGGTGGISAPNGNSGYGGFGGGGCEGNYGGGVGGGGGGYGGGGSGSSDGQGSGGGGGGSFDITNTYSGTITNSGMGYVIIY